MINISAGSEIELHEINEATRLITECVDEDAEVIFGTVIDEDLGEYIKVTVLATGLKTREQIEQERQAKLKPKTEINRPKVIARPKPQPEETSIATQTIENTAKQMTQAKAEKRTETRQNISKRTESIRVEMEKKQAAEKAIRELAPPPFKKTARQPIESDETRTTRTESTNTNSRPALRPVTTRSKTQVDTAALEKELRKAREVAKSTPEEFTTPEEQRTSRAESLAMRLGRLK